MIIKISTNFIWYYTFRILLNQNKGGGLENVGAKIFYSCVIPDTNIDILLVTQQQGKSRKYPGTHF